MTEAYLAIWRDGSLSSALQIKKEVDTLRTGNFFRPDLQSLETEVSLA